MYFCLEKSSAQRLVLLLMTLGITACAGREVVTLPEPLSTPDNVVQQSGEANKPAVEGNEFAAGIEGLDFTLLAPKGQEVNRSKHQFPNEKLYINADKMPLNKFIHTALGELLLFNLHVDPAIADRVDPVSLNVVKPVKPEILLGMIEETLQLMDVGLIPTKSGLKVVPAAKLLTSPPQLLAQGSLLSQGQVLAFIPLEYADIQETLLFSNSVFELGRHGRVMYNDRLGAMMVQGSAERVRRFQDLIAALDKPSLKDRTIRLIEPEYWQVDELIEMLTKLLGTQNIPVFDKATRKNGLQFIALGKINTLIVVSPNKDWADFVVNASKKIDRPSAKGDRIGNFVYFVKNARAEQLGLTITTVLSSSGSQLASNREKSDLNANLSDASSIVPSETQGRLRVIPDLQRNALIFVGSGNDYEDILPLLEQLDIPARQVLIDVTIAELTLDNSSSLGTEWSLNDLAGKSVSTLGGLGLGGAGLTYTNLKNTSQGELLVRLNALAESGRVKILSRPRLLAMDNEEAKIQVGTQISVLSKEIADTSSVDSSSTGIVRSFTYIDTGVILSVTPAINEGGVVQLKLSQEVSEVGTDAGESPPILKRTIETTLLSKSGQTVMIGGLITDNDTENVIKVPLLGDIPGLGILFQSKVVTKRSTELIMLVTPYIINNSNDAEHYTRAFQEELNWK